MNIHIKNLLSRCWPIISILIIECYLFWANYRSGTYFLGWDNLWPEANFGANIVRSFFSVWQEYRGLGLLDGMSYAANLPHYLILYLLSFVFPENVLRYLFIFLMHAIGGIGMYLLIRGLLREKRTQQLCAFLGSILYLYSLATIQMFYAPYELFVVHFAFLPWLTIFILKFLQSGKKGSLVAFAIVSFFAVSQAHVPTIFIVYIILVATLLAFKLLYARDRNQSFKRIIAVLCVIFAINSFWLLPYGYGVISGIPGTVVEAKINEMSRRDIVAKNEFRGQLQDFIHQKGFLLDVVELNKQVNGYEFIMKDWNAHVSSEPWKVSSIIIFLITMVGTVSSLLFRKKKLLPFFFTMLISFFFLANDTPILKELNDLLRRYVPFFAEAFRFSFTKFSIINTFSFAIFFAFGVEWCADLILTRFKTRGKHMFLVVGVGIFVLIINYSLPAFHGHFLFDSERIKLPIDYSESINYFKSQDVNTRIAFFPQNTFWSWRFYNFGYRGSGFFWYGIPQSTMDRAFDPWSSQNENYFWEMAYALYSKNSIHFQNVLEKYQINWLVLDRNVVNPPSPKALYNDELIEIIKTNNRIHLEKTFGGVEIYSVQLASPVKNYLFSSTVLPNVVSKTKWSNDDAAFEQSGIYKTNMESVEEKGSVVYPFRSLFSGKRQEDVTFKVTESSNAFSFEGLFDNKSSQELVLPVPISADLIPNFNSQGKLELLSPHSFVKDKTLEILIPKNISVYSKTVLPSTEFETQLKLDCNQVSNGKTKLESDSKSSIKIRSLGSSGCLSFYFPDLPHKYGYLISVESKYVSGRPILFWLENLNSRRPDLETYLPEKKGTTVSFFIQPPMEEDGFGYTLHFDNSSIGRDETVNELGKISIEPIPYEFMSHITAGTFDYETKLSSVVSSHQNPSVYEISDVAHLLDKTIILSQSFDKGWSLYIVDKDLPWILSPVFGMKNASHTLINNWENGWALNDLGRDLNNKKIVIVYLPQYLEFFGLGILGILIIGSLVYYFRGRK